MKVTALMDDEIIRDVRNFSRGKTITESLTIALKDWINIQKIKKLNEEIAKNPLQFQPGFTAEKVRKLNRRKRY